MGLAYEGVILFGVVFFFGYGFSAVTRFQGVPGGLRTAFQLFMLGVLGAYFVYFWSDGRRTLPMKTLAMALQTTSGDTVSVARATWRYLLAAGWLVLCLGAARLLSPWCALAMVVPWLWTVVDADRRSLIDRAAGTRLVSLPPAPAGQERTQST